MAALTTPVRRAFGRPDRRDLRRVQLIALTALAGYSTGVGWQAQAVSYPFFRTVPPQEFPAYHLTYNAAIPLVVVVPGFLTFVACMAFPWTRPSDVPRSLAAVVGLTGLGSLVSTVAWAIPMHDRLDRIGQDPATIDSLLNANLVRSLLLTGSTVALVVAAVRSGRSR